VGRRSRRRAHVRATTRPSAPDGAGRRGAPPACRELSRTGRPSTPGR
jgi:hypothetical protein